MELKFLPIDYGYFDSDGKNFIRIVGRNDAGKKVCLIDSFQPFLYAVLKQGISEASVKKLADKIEKIEIDSKGRKTKVEKVKIEDKNFLGKPVKALKIFVTNYKDAHEIADHLDFPEITERREYDISIITKYIVERGLDPLVWHKIDCEVLEPGEFNGIENMDADICLKIKKIEKIEKEDFKPKILAFDIEADDFEIGKGEIVMISLVSENFKKVLTWKKKEKQDFVECFADEAEMLKKFVEYTRAQNPDFLVGYFSDGFDLPYLKARCEKNRVKLALGIDSSQPTFSRGKRISASIFGITHIDLFRFIETVYSQYMQSETLGLNEVAKELIGEGKLDFEFKKSEKIKEHEWKAYFLYNLQDSILTFKLAEKLFPEIREFTRIIKEPIFETTRDSMSQHVENYILHNLSRFNEIAEKRPLHNEIEERRTREKYEGAFVFQPIPGLYENLAVFDFTSMYASVIVSHNLSKSTFLEKKQPDSLEVETEKGKNYFSKKQGFFPSLLGEIIEKRKKYKHEYKANPYNLLKARSNAYKLLANASYGYLGFFGARYYCLEAASSTASLARKFIKEVIDKTNKEGYKVVYADTDGFAFLLNDKNKKETLEFLKKLNDNLPGIMELELEDFYKRGLWVTKRTGEFGAKKKYALITEQDKMKIRGFETVRRDWCNLARELQNKVLERILKDGNEKKALEIFKETIKKIKKREIEKKEIMIRTQLKKLIEEYKSITPHVIAAKKMQEQGMPLGIGMLIEYFIAETRETKSLVREKVKLADEKGEYNIKYYLEHQIIPAVENIFEVFGVNVKEISDGKKQMKLSGF